VVGGTSTTFGLDPAASLGLAPAASLAWAGGPLGLGWRHRRSPECHTPLTLCAYAKHLPVRSGTPVGAAPDPVRRRRTMASACVRA